MNLSQKYKPKSLDEILSQEHLVGKNGIFKKFLEKSYFPHSVLFGPSGVGKTTLARLIAKELSYDFYEFNATSIKIDEIRRTLKKYQNSLLKPIIFIDEIHRLSRNQEETLLPFMENRVCILIGASTTNPYYSLSSAFRSRSHLFRLNSIKNSDLREFILKVSKNEKITIKKEAIDYILNSSNGDVRGALNLLESAIIVSDGYIDIDILKLIRSEALRDGISSKESSYDFISAMIKSIRGSDIDASLYYLARVIDEGENPEFIARRLAILASEDIGNANPNALNLAASTINIVSKIGYPEARIPLSQLIIYLASSPKSNSAYKAINKALEIVKTNKLNIPQYLKRNSKNYLYPHDFGGYIKQKYLEKNFKIYESSNIGFEKTLNEWLVKIKK